VVGTSNNLPLKLPDGTLYAGGWNDDLWNGTWLTGDVALEAWNHVVLVLDAEAPADQLRLFVNGVASGAGFAAPLYGHGPANLGAADQGSRYFAEPAGFETSAAPNGFGGLIDDVRIHARPLTTAVWPNGADFDPATLHDWPEHIDALTALARKWEHQSA
jgi:hypothetical protein